MDGDTIANNKDQPPPAAATKPASASAPTAATERCGWCRADFQRLWVHKGVCCQCEASLRQSGQCPTGAVANRSITSASGVGATARSSRGAGTGSAGARNSSSENATVTASANADASAGASESGAAAADRAAARAAARLKAGHVASACPGSRAWCAHANRYAQQTSVGVLGAIEAIRDEK